MQGTPHKITDKSAHSPPAPGHARHRGAVRLICPADEQHSGRNFHDLATLVDFRLRAGGDGRFFAAQTATEPPAGQTMIAAVDVFRKSLTPDQLQQASFQFDDAERLNWHFIPRPRKGLPLKELEGNALQSGQDVHSQRIVRGRL